MKNSVNKNNTINYFLYVYVLLIKIKIIPFICAYPICV